MSREQTKPTLIQYTHTHTHTSCTVYSGAVVEPLIPDTHYTTEGIAHHPSVST